METPPPPPLPPDVMRAVQEALQRDVRAIQLPNWPVYALSDRPDEGWLSHGGGTAPSNVSELVLSYRPPNEAERLLVWSRLGGEAAPDDEQLLRWVATGDLDDLPGQESAAAAAVPPTASTAITIDGTSVAAAITGRDQATLMRINLPDLHVDVLARGLPLDQVSLHRVTDLRPFQARRDAVIRSLLPPSD